MTADIDFNVRLVLTGKSHLVMHNPRTADPDDDFSMQIAEIVAKKKEMTPEDRKRKEDLQWRASLYTEMVKDDGDQEPRERLIAPMIWVSRSLEAGGSTLGSGTASKGAAVMRSVTPTETFMVLTYDGPQDIPGLLADSRFRWRALVNPNPSGGKKGRLPSVRAIVPRWSVTTVVNVVTDMGLSWENFEKAARAAGNIGIGDARKLGYGRFSVKLTKLR